jgi:hypothetical protein
MHSPLGARRRPDEYYDDEYYYEDDEYMEESRPPPLDLDVDMDLLENEQETAVGAGVYKVYFDDTLMDPQQLELDWEPCDDGTVVLLPPPYVSAPKSVIHFVGGTFFGSSPKLWYRTLLEGIVRTTSSVVIATPVPVTLLRNPLHHVRISRQLQRQFQTAYVNVVQDEYGMDELTNVPIVGMGHSLGARLLTVLATLSPPKDKKKIPPYKSYILMSFTNYGSAASIPGIQSLLSQSRRLENDNKNNNQGYNNNNNKRRRKDYDDDDMDEDDEEWEELMQDLTSAWREQAARVKTALTPASKELEFYPSPDQLWQALKDDGRYTIPNTLVIQFDQDVIDQSPRLTDCLLESTDIFYCRLKGSHLTPVSASRNENEEKEEYGNSLLELSKQTTRKLWKLVRGKQSPYSSNELRDLRLSISRYITDVVAAPTTTKTTATRTSDEPTKVTSVDTESL